MKPRVAISSCLLGQPVRYDGGHKLQAWLRDELPGYAELVPICPEAGAGLGVPRPPVRLVETRGRVLALGVEDPALDVTDDIRRYVQDTLRELSLVQGFILKARSPSCGHLTTPVYDEKGDQIRLASGLFAEYICKALPEKPIIDEEGMQDDMLREAFLDQLS